MNAPRVAYDGRALVQSHGVHDPLRIVLHDTESHDAAGIRDIAGVCTYWHGIGWGPGAQRIIDADGNIGLAVVDGEIAYHVQNRNTGSLGLEIIGFARWSLTVWMLRPKQLEAVALQLAYWSDRHAIPLRRDPEHGVSTHAEQSRLHGGTHWDPGRFPVDRVLKRAAEIKAGAIPKRPTKPYTEDDFWLWLRWTLGEGEFQTAGDANPTVRPARLPHRIPDRWFARRDAFRKKRAAARERDLATT